MKEAEVNEFFILIFARVVVHLMCSANAAALTKTSTTAKSHFNFGKDILKLMRRSGSVLISIITLQATREITQTKRMGARVNDIIILRLQVIRPHCLNK